jgi:hypothetical protein
VRAYSAASRALAAARAARRPAGSPPLGCKTWSCESNVHILSRRAARQRQRRAHAAGWRARWRAVARARARTRRAAVWAVVPDKPAR